jgi:chemotaxis protein MotB
MGEAIRPNDYCSMARKKEHAHENHERWLLTYADMITLLVAFFIMLYAMSVMNQHKFQQVAISVRSGFGGNVIGSAPSILDGRGESTADISMTEQGSGDINKEVQEIAPQLVPRALLVHGNGGGSPLMDKTLQRLKDVIKSEHLEKTVMVQSEERGIVVTVLTDKFLFDQGQADLRPQFTYVLDSVSRPLRAIPNLVRIEGHTDDLPICTPKFPSNWELSATRATNVLRYFVDQNELPAARLSVAGYADTRPLVPNTSDENRALNRRVEIVVLKTSDASDD